MQMLRRVCLFAAGARSSRSLRVVPAVPGVLPTRHGQGHQVTGGEAIERYVGDAINAAVSEHEHGMVTRWVAVLEIIDGEGERAILTLASEDLRQWDSIGMLDFALSNERAGIVRDKLRDDG